MGEKKRREKIKNCAVSQEVVCQTKEQYTVCKCYSFFTDDDLGNGVLLKSNKVVALIWRDSCLAPFPYW